MTEIEIGTERGRAGSVSNLCLFFMLFVMVTILFSPLAYASTGCNYPTSLDSWIDKSAPATLSIAEVNQFRCGIEKLESGPLRPNKGSASAPAYSFQGDTDSGVDSLGADQVSLFTGGVERLRATNSGILIGTTVGTAAAAGEMVLANAKALRGVNAAASNTLNLISLDSSDRLVTRLWTWPSADGIVGQGLVSDGAGIFSFISPVANPRNRRWVYSVAAATAAQSLGLAITETGTCSSSAVTSSTFSLRSCASAATSGSDAGFESGQEFTALGAKQLRFHARFRIGPTALAMRTWAGLFTNTLAVVVASDNPASSYVGFRYSTVAGDVNFKACTRDGAGLQLCTDTGVAPAGLTFFNLEIFYNSTSSVVFKINNNTVATHTTNLPTETDLLRVILGVETEEAVAKSAAYEHIFVDSAAF